MSLPYAAFWCEEVCWHLAVHPAPGPGRRLVLMILGAAGHVALWSQRAGTPRGPVLWDYHVVVAASAPDGWHIWDQDSRLGCPLPATAWIDGTFPCPERVPAEFRPRFRLLSADAYRDVFASDRRHMRDASGDWQKPLPPWPAIGDGGNTLPALLDPTRPGPGDLLDLIGLRQRLG